MGKRVVLSILLCIIMLMPLAQAVIIEHGSSHLEKVLISNMRLIPLSNGDYHFSIEVDRTLGSSIDNVQVVVFLYGAPWGAFFSEKKDLVNSVLLDARDITAPDYNIANDYLIVNVYGDGFKKTRIVPAKLFM